MFIKLTDIYKTEHRINISRIFDYKKAKTTLPDDDTFPGKVVECVRFTIDRVTHEQIINVIDKTVEEYDVLLYELINENKRW